MSFLEIVLAIGAGILVGFVAMRFMNVDRSKIHLLDKDDFMNNMRKGQLIDIRKAEQYDQDKIKGARNFKPGALTAKYTKLRKDQSVYLYCQNGRKSWRTARAMSRKEFSDIYVLKGGLNSTLEK